MFRGFRGFRGFRVQGFGFRSRCTQGVPGGTLLVEMDL